MTSTTRHSSSRFYGAEIDIYDQDYPQDKHTFIVHTVHPQTGDLWASNEYGEQIYVPADEIPCDIRMATVPAKHPQQRRYCDQIDHGTGTDAEADRWCYEHHNVQMPRTRS